MGKRIIQQARGKGSLTYRVKKKAFKHKLGYKDVEGKGEVIKLIDSAGHTCPIAKVKFDNEIFFIPAAEKMYEGQEIEIGKVKEGNIVNLKEIPIGTEIFCIENKPGDGGKLIRSGGSFAIVKEKVGNKIILTMPSKKDTSLDEKCKAIIGRAAGGGRKEKPIVKAGKKFHIMKAKSKLYPRTSAVAMNVVDHPFGSGRGKNISHGNKGKTSKANAAPGAKVGHFRPRRTGRKRK